MDEFTEQEKEILLSFVTSVERDIFVLTNLPEVIKGALFSRYSRSTKSVRRLLLDEFLKDPQSGLAQLSFDKTQAESLRAAVKKAQDFYDRVLDGYGDDSVGELGGAHVACENVSILATKVLEDARIGGSPLEKSTRYVWFDQKVNGDFLFYKESKIMASKHKELYLKINRKLFQTYADLVVPVTDFVKLHFPLEQFAFFDPATKAEIPFSSISDEKLKKRASIAYNAAVRAKACDLLRGLLPASTLTNMGVFGNGRFFQGLISRLKTSDISEMQIIGSQMHEELDKVMPSFVRRAKSDEYTKQNIKNMTSFVSKLSLHSANSSKMVSLVEFDADAENKILAAALYPHSSSSFESLTKAVSSFSLEQKNEILSAYIGKRKTRRDKPYRAFEHVYYTFDILADYGLFRDLHRHRLLTQQRQVLTTRHGFDLPYELEVAGLADKFVECMNEASNAFEEIASDFPNEAQYVVPLAYNIRWYMKMNLREALHFIELRSTPQGHAGYRKVAQLMFKEIEKVHPVFASSMNFVDLNDYPLGRLKSELRKEEKKELRGA